MGIKINQLLQKLPKGAVATDYWLKKNGISNDLKRRYIASKWLEYLGRGASKRHGDAIDWPGALWGLLQQETKLHIGGKTALGLQGLAHYMRKDEAIDLFTQHSKKLPQWFYRIVDKKKIHLIDDTFLSTHLGIFDLAVEGLMIPTSRPERAILEQIYLIGKYETFEETSLLMETLTSLQPSLVQQLLELCTSIKVKRVFLFLSEYHSQAWFKKLRIDQIDLGSGKRQIVSNGALNKKYNITVPKGFINEHEKSLY